MPFGVAHMKEDNANNVSFCDPLYMVQCWEQRIMQKYFTKIF